MILEKKYHCVEYIDEPTFDLSLGRLCAYFDYYTNQDIQPIFCLTENTQPTRDFDDYVYICTEHYSHLRNVLIFINDKFYFDILESSGFTNVNRVYGNAAVGFDLTINEFIDKFELSINDIKFKFQRLSNSRHDHNYYIMDFLKQNNLLKETMWSYLNGGKFYYNFNRFLGINRESDYKIFDEKRVCGTTESADMDKSAIKLVQKCGIVINCESSYHRHGPCYSEKLVKCALAGRPFIEVSTAGTIEDLHQIGISTFPDLIDESFDKILDPKKRIEKICDEIQRLAKYDIQYIKDYITEHHEILQNNFNVFKNMHNELKNNNIDSVILEKTEN